MTSSAPKPYMPEAECIALTEHLKTAHCYLEFGMGGSTVLAAWQGLAHIFSVDSSPTWIKQVSSQIKQFNSPSRVELLFADIGETGEWGFPVDQQKECQWPDYYARIWTRLGIQSPDLVLIDGRFRVACFLYSLLNLKPGAIILWDDYKERPEYHGIEQHLHPLEYFGNMAKFVVPSHIINTEILSSLFEHLYDAR